MIHEIHPHKLYNEFQSQQPKPDDFLIIFNGEKTLMKQCGDKFAIPLVGDFNAPCHYLFRIDDKAYFGAEFDWVLEKFKQGAELEGFSFEGTRRFRFFDDLTERLGGATATHILRWEYQNQHCGICGSKTLPSEKERAKVCTSCHHTFYPKICPVVIVAVHNGNKLLMARNLDHPDKKTMYLISGFVEVGESLEQAVEREVLEEAGIHVKNIRYFGSQPWPFSDSLIAGYTAELDGSEELHIQESEIATAAWVERKDIPPYDTSVGISGTMIEDFRLKV